MIPLTTLKSLYDYNWWARDRQLDACAPLSPEQFLRPLGSSFSSLRDTFTHLLGVEWLYLERLCGRSPITLPVAGDFPSLPAIRERWLTVEDQLRDVLAGLDDAKLAEIVHYTNMKGQQRTYARWQTLFHLLNHQSYHRGQVTTMIRQLGAAPSAVDFYVYLDTRK